MKIRSMSVSLVAAVLAVGTILPASAQVTAVPREGVAFSDTVTQRVKVETVDPDDRTIAFTTPDGQVLVLPVSPNAGNLANIADGSTANVTYSQIVTMLNLRQKGPGSKEARRDQMNVKPNKTDIEAGRFTLTVTAVDLPNNTVSVIEGDGGAVRTYKANTIAKQDMLKKIKVGDVVIGLTTPLMVTAVSPAN
ncbi:hypothetical protein RSO01_52590 [Reyranella soli]|jgi:hypothetical protein|uniref:Uncharacterized protein n=2 Tax=Reyranella soli TaxID=1230389 RepID=A0A512NGL5_9HYPH|nr:hypothetical protein RSO01_52590 [Reyranella soli]